MPKYHSFEHNFKIRPTSNRKSTVFLSKTPEEKLLIFIHGFGGHPTETWYDFPNMLLERAEFAHHDFIFYNYDSKHVQVTSSGISLHDFICDLIVKANYFSLSELAEYERPASFRYKKIVFVAHSLGAIVCRHALNRSYVMNRDWHAITRMLLFAPAHMGSMGLRPIFNLFYSSGLSFIANAVRYTTVTMNDVDLSLIDCSLHQLIAETSLIQLGPDHLFTIAGKVIWAEYERVVNNHKFLKDPESDLAYDKDHTAVCKPNNNYTDPVNTLLSMI